MYPIKFNLKIEASYHIPNIVNSMENRAFKSSAKAVLAESDVNEIIEAAYAVIMAEQDAYTSKGIGFSLQCIDGLLLGVFISIHRWLVRCKFPHLQTSPIKKQ